MIPGHSFLPNDIDFGYIESVLKLQQRLYTLEDYKRIMESCKKKTPRCQAKDDFVSTLKLEKAIVNRKKDTEKTKSTG